MTCYLSAGRRRGRGLRRWGCVVSLVLVEVVKWRYRDGGGGIILCFRGRRGRGGGGKGIETWWQSVMGC